MMQLRVQTYPPLGQLTTSPVFSLPLTAILEVPSGQTDSWEVRLWRSTDGGSWTEQPLERADTDATPFLFHTKPSVANLCFTTTVYAASNFQFTLKIRRGPNDEWSWAKDVCGLEDGSIIMTESIISVKEDKPPLPELADGFKVTEHASQSPGAQLWYLTVDVDACKNDNSTYKDLVIGKPWGGFSRWFALDRRTTPWLGPRHGRYDVELPRDAIVCSFQNAQGQHLVMLAVTGDNHVVSVLRNTFEGGVQLHARNDSLESATSTILVSLSDNFESALAAVVYEARKLVSSSGAAADEMQKLSDEIEPQWTERWYDGLGYCTWNALGPTVTEESLLDALNQLADHKISISNLIIDDGWQSIDSTAREWKAFEADSEAFPKGLASTVSHIRSKFPGLSHIAVWHSIVGYWGGLSPEGEIAKKYKTEWVMCGFPYAKEMLLVDKKDVSRMYKDFYEFLSDAGVDSVKTDVQHVLDCMIASWARRDLIREYLDAWTLSSLRTFNYRAISCMSQFPQGIFHSQIQQNRPTLVVRNSDDFVPEDPDSHAWHLWANAHNSILTRFLNVLPDWDMFQTSHEFAGYHAAARCVSGGPIYITDSPGKHNLDLIKQMTGVNVRGRTVIFRPSVVGRSITQYVGFEEGQLLKVGAYNGASITGSPILGVFNISKWPIAEIIPVASFTGATPSIDYVVRSHTTGRVSPRMQCGGTTANVSVSLDVRGYDILTATPLQLFTGKKHRDIWIGTLGLVEKMTGCAAILSNDVTKQENGRVSVTTKLKALGVFGIWISTLPKMSIDGDFLVTILGQPVPRHTVRISETSECVLEVDIETAWDEMKLSSGWSNEVEVKVNFSS